MIKKSSFFILIFVFICAFLSSNSSAQAFSFYHGRAFALGGAYTGLVDDYSAILYNPAALGLYDETGLGFGSTLGGRSANLIGVISNIREVIDDPLKIINNDWDSVAMEYGHLTGLRFGPVGAGISFHGKGTLVDSELQVNNYLAYNLAFAYRIVEPFADIGALAVGINARYVEGVSYRYWVEQDSGGTGEESTILGSGLGADLGIIIKLTDIINIGARIENAIKPFSSSSNHYHKGLERIYTVGAGIKLPLVGLTATTDISTIPHSSGTAFRGGVEQRLFFGLLALRAGLAQEGADQRLYTGGIGLNFGPIQADLALGFEEGAWREPSAVMGLSASF